jgi:hypothetical protein
MEQHIAKPSGNRHSKEEILKILEEGKNSDLNVKEFVKTKSIHAATYYIWRNRYGDKAQKQRSLSGFARLKINPSPDNNGPVLFAEVKGIKIFQSVSASYLKELL